MSDYYDGTGYRMAFIKDPDNLKRRFFKFRTQSRETNALLFVIGNEVSVSLNIHLWKRAHKPEKTFVGVPGHVLLPDCGGRLPGAARTAGRSGPPSPECCKSLPLCRSSLTHPEFTLRAPPESMSQLNRPVLSQDQQFAVVIDDAFTVHYGPDRISVQHIRTSYVSYYIGGLPASLRRR